MAHRVYGSLSAAAFKQVLPYFSTSISTAPSCESEASDISRQTRQMLGRKRLLIEVRALSYERFKLLDCGV